MSLEASQVVAAALELPPDERADVIEALVRSLDAGDELDDEDRGRLHEAILRSEEQLQAGRGVPAADVLDRLRIGKS
jgi:hypothetical protein